MNKKEEELFREVRLSHRKYFGGRCGVCQIKLTYLAKALSMLRSWSSSDRKTEEWKKKVISFRCRER